MVLGEKLKLEMLAPSLTHYRGERGIKHNVIFRPLQEDKRAKKTVYHLTHNELIHGNNDYYSSLKMPGEKYTIAFVISN